MEASAEESASAYLPTTKCASAMAAEKLKL
jgi:hypothetical protein